MLTPLGPGQFNSFDKSQRIQLQFLTLQQGPTAYPIQTHRHRWRCVHHPRLKDSLFKGALKHLTKPLKLASNYMAYSHCKNPKMQQFEEHCHNHHRVEIHFQMTMSWNWDPEKLPIPPRKNGMGARNTLIRMKWKLGILLFEWDEFGSSSSDSHPN